jgi:hypothetical protein
MSLPPAVDAFISNNLTLFVGALATISLLSFVILLILLRRVGRLTRLYRRLTQGTSGGNLEEQLLGYLDQVRNVDERMASLEQRAHRLNDGYRRCLQNVGVVRYDAFEDVGGEQSFSVALTDADRNGTIISSVYSRSDVRVYAKSLVNGRASHALSVEEQRALVAAEPDNRKLPEVV